MAVKTFSTLPFWCCNTGAASFLRGNLLRVAASCREWLRSDTRCSHIAPPDPERHRTDDRHGNSSRTTASAIVNHVGHVLDVAGVHRQLQNRAAVTIVPGATVALALRRNIGRTGKQQRAVFSVHITIPFFSIKAHKTGRWPDVVRRNDGFGNFTAFM